MNFADFSLPFLTNPSRARATADYMHVLTGEGVLVIFDKLGPRSVTNDMEAVLDDIAADEHRGSLCGVLVTYRDSQGEFCQVVLNEQGRFGSFRSFGKRVTDEAEAVALLRQMPA